VAERPAAQVMAEAKPSRMPAAPDPGSRDRVKCGVDLDNSLEIRKSLLAMALQMIPQAGPFGLGLDAFQQNTCLGMPPHNTILQTAIELGWVGGSMLMALVAAMMWRLLPIARTDRAVAFLLCSLAYVCVLSLVHGRLSRQGDLFLILGASAGVVTSLNSARRKSV
jgi:O-antigen ligase